MSAITVALIRVRSFMAVTSHGGGWGDANHDARNSDPRLQRTPGELHDDNTRTPCGSAPNPPFTRTRPVVGGAPIGYLVFASLVDARSVTALVGTGVGRVCLVVGLALEALAAVWMRRIVASEPA
jgi:hypothetical protein